MLVHFFLETSVYYDFSGAIDNIYSSLVASLALDNTFGSMRLWEDRAEFENPPWGQCGLRKVDKHQGYAHLDIYFGEPIAEAVRDLFTNFVEDHLRQHGVEIFEHIQITCTCGFAFAESSVRKRISTGHDHITCPECDRKLTISQGAEKIRELRPEVSRKTWALRTKIEERRREIVRETKVVMESAERDLLPRDYLWVLHLSDLHISDSTNVAVITQPLIEDLRDRVDGFGLNRLDYLVISGDLSNTAHPDEFEKAFIFTSNIVKTFRLSSQRCLVVPGNHDVDWSEEVYSWRTLRSVELEKLEAGSFVLQDKVVLQRDENRYPNRFKNFSNHYYHKFFQQPYPLVFEDQCQPVIFSEDCIQFILMNSCWNIDEFFHHRSGIHLPALMAG